jgi:hypothetical protein
MGESPQDADGKIAAEALNARVCGRRRPEPAGTHRVPLAVSNHRTAPAPGANRANPNGPTAAQSGAFALKVQVRVARGIGGHD